MCGAEKAGLSGRGLSTKTQEKKRSRPGNAFHAQGTARTKVQSRKEHGALEWQEGRGRKKESGTHEGEEDNRATS